MAVVERSIAAGMVVVAPQGVQEWKWAQMRLLILDMLTRGCKMVGCDLVGFDFDGMGVEQWSQGQG